MRPGDIIEIRVLKADGRLYRRWQSTVERVEPDRVVTINRAGDRVTGPGGGWTMKQANRTIYWFDRPYNLVEMYHPDGRLKQIYIHIASPAHLSDAVLTYTDHELDVVKRPGQPLCIRDEDEFATACAEFGYSDDFQYGCRCSVEEAMNLALQWKPQGAPCTVRRRRRSRGRQSGRSPGVVRTETPATDSRTRSTEV